MRQVHLAGDKMFVDYAGATLEVIDGITGKIRSAQVFVAVPRRFQLQDQRSEASLDRAHSCRHPQSKGPTLQVHRRAPGEFKV